MMGGGMGMGMGGPMMGGGMMGGGMYPQQRQGMGAGGAVSRRTYRLCEG